MDERAVSALKRRRGVTRASITRLGGKIKELEGKPAEPSTLDAAKRMKTKVESLDSEFRSQHYALIDVIENEDDLPDQQEILDEHDDAISLLATRLQGVMSACSPSTSSDPRRIQSQRLLQLERSLSSVHEQIKILSGSPDDICLIQQHEEQLADFKIELRDIRNYLLPLALEEKDELNALKMKLEKVLFDFSLSIKCLLRNADGQVTGPSSSDTPGVRLPKLDVPTFDGNVVNWKSFWEQFCVSVHERTNLSDPEKLVYLQHAVKGGPAKHAI